MRPVIGINLCLRPGENYLDNWLFLRMVYVQAVIRAGGLPVLMPVVEDVDLLAEMMQRVDGILMTGGDPKYRAMTVEKPDEAGNIPDLPDLETQNPRRHAFDLALCRMALEKNMPLLGICRGHQTLNEAAGGTMILNLYRVTDWQHRQKEPMDQPTHKVKFTAGSVLKEIFEAGGGELWVNSLHRQAVDRPAPGFVISSYSHDGIAESVESKKHDFAVGVQFHPEMLLHKDKKFINIYNRLVIASKKYREKSKA